MYKTREMVMLFAPFRLHQETCCCDGFLLGLSTTLHPFAAPSPLLPLDAFLLFHRMKPFSGRMGVALRVKTAAASLVV